MDQFKYHAISPKQSSFAKVFAFSATAKDIFQFATVDRIARDEDGKLQGFQRPQFSQTLLLLLLPKVLKSPKPPLPEFLN
jgi:hypothetical protein